MKRKKSRRNNGNRTDFLKKLEKIYNFLQSVCKKLQAEVNLLTLICRCDIKESQDIQTFVQNDREADAQC